MSISLNSNLAATRAASDLTQHYAAQQKTINQLTTGERMVSAADDTGAFSNAIDLRSALSRSSATTAILANSLTFLQAQGSALQHLAKIVSRMSEISSMMRDATKSTEDLDTYASEFKALQNEMIGLSAAKFNELNLFGTPGSGAGSLTVQTADDPAQTITLTQSDLESVKAFLFTENGFDQTSYATDGSGLWGPNDLADSQNGVFGAILSGDMETIAQMLADNATQQTQVRISMDRVQNMTLSIERTHGLLADTDVSKATQSLSRSNVLIQASASALTTANQVQESMLSLLKPS